MRLVWGKVVSAEPPTAGLQRLRVVPDDGVEADALCYVGLSGACRDGERVLLNTTAVDLSLGTGGAHFVVARAGDGESPPSGVALAEHSGGHIMKLRYTPLQTDVLSVEAPESPHHQTMVQAESIEGMPVVCCGLHSQVPLVAAAVKRRRPDARVAYCMTDQAALPVALSSIVAQSLETGLIDTTVTTGQAFGGMVETVTLHSGLLAAKHVARADVAVVAIGPGVAGTGTPFGHGGVAQGEAINAVSALAGVPIACLRMSFADERTRHRGVSHHTLAALVRIALAPSRVAVPTLPREFSDSIAADLESAGVWSRHERWESEEGSVEAPSLRGMRVTTMGRDAAEDPAFFAAAFAAGEIASRSA